MKKSFKNALLAFALIAAGTGAYAMQIANQPNAGDPTYDWTGTGPNGSGFQPDLTRTQAVSYYGCNLGNDDCAEGIPTAGGATIYLEQN